MNVAITGGSGIVGSAVVRHLVTAGHEVLALARTDESARKVESLGAEAVRGDVLEARSLQRLVEGAERVFHVAGVNEICPRDARRMWDVNVDGTRNIVDACRRAGVPKLVHTSSASTIGHGKGAVGSEATRHRGWHLSRYERSKAAAEEVAFRGAPGLQVVAVNPSSVQGPGRATGTGRLFLAAARGRLPFAVDAMVSFVDIEDCARGHLLAGEAGMAGERYVLAGASLAVSDALALLSAVLEREVKTRLVPPGVVMPIAGLVEGVFALTRTAAPLCREMVRILAHGHAYDGSRASRELGLEYTPLIETIGRTIDWFRAEGLLRRRR